MRPTISKMLIRILRTSVTMAATALITALDTTLMTATATPRATLPNKFSGRPSAHNALA
ncbi:hypothetical protein BDZ85DRAFT_257612 [Elsinoe ampelina]|uniref:Uncharacterized protein n=2 Tax=Elsinoe TaxID=40996 RepID=A0A8K0LH01_9PEZI|nr:hypothetical protein BDZ85DRAFT_257612 [Elsinoe ampelina]KAG8631973.1 hypothetical protein KVT40_001113 [Elsinoe batatas]